MFENRHICSLINTNKATERVSQTEPSTEPVPSHTQNLTESQEQTYSRSHAQSKHKQSQAQSLYRAICRTSHRAKRNASRQHRRPLTKYNTNNPQQKTKLYKEPRTEQAQTEPSTQPVQSHMQNITQSQAQRLKATKTATPQKTLPIIHGHKLTYTRSLGQSKHKQSLYTAPQRAKHNASSILLGPATQRIRPQDWTPISII